MEEKKLYTIGKMAQLCEVSVKTLRYYEEIGLLVPEIVSPDSGYRYYSENQVGLMGIIIGLKASDYKIGEIKEFLHQGNVDFLENQMNERIQRINLEIEILNKKKIAAQNRVVLFKKAREYRQKRLENSSEPEIRHVKERKIITVRKKDIPSLGEVSSRFIHIVHQCKHYQLDNREHFLIMHEKFSINSEKSIDFEACCVLEGDVPNLPFIRTIPANNYVVFHHEGERKEAAEVLKKIPLWFENNPYRPVGPLEIVYLMSYYHTKNQDYSVSDIQIPVQKTGVDNTKFF